MSLFTTTIIDNIWQLENGRNIFGWEINLELSVDPCNELYDIMVMLWSNWSKENSPDCEWNCPNHENHKHWWLIALRFNLSFKNTFINMVWQRGFILLHKVGWSNQKVGFAISKRFAKSTNRDARLVIANRWGDYQACNNNKQTRMKKDKVVCQISYRYRLYGIWSQPIFILPSRCIVLYGMVLLIQFFWFTDLFPWWQQSNSYGATDFVTQRQWNVI